MKTTKTMIKIFEDLKKRGEKFSSINEETGIIKTSREGKNQVVFNYWIFENNELKCIDCKTIIY